MSEGQVLLDIKNPTVANNVALSLYFLGS